MKLLSLCLMTVFISLPHWSAANVLIKDVRVVSPGKPVSAAVDVLLEGETIRAIGQLTARGDQMRVDQVIEGKGRFLTPGLIDSHVHLQGVPGESPAMPQAVREEAISQIPRSYLYFGFTTVLDLFSADSLIDGWNKQPLAPTAYHCAGVPIPGGYPLAWIPPEEQLHTPSAQYYLYDLNQPELMKATPGSDNHKPRPLVERIASTDARCIKIFYETGFGGLKNLPVPSPDIVRQLVTAAHAHQLPVYLHGNSEDAYEFALQTGVDMLVHGLWHGEPGQAATLADRVAGAGLKVQPTMRVIHSIRDLFNPAYFEKPEVAHAMPPASMSWYRSEAGQWMAKEISQEISDGSTTQGDHHVHGAADAALARPFEVLERFTAALLRKGEAVFGSDTPSGPIYTQFPGLNGWREMQLWVEAGATSEQLFNALTIGNARVLSLEEVLGTVDVGKRADLLLLKRNPRESASNWDSIEWVIVKGRPIKREMLSAKRLVE